MMNNPMNKEKLWKAGIYELPNLLHIRATKVKVKMFET